MLLFTALSLLAIILSALAALLFDYQLIDGISIWSKPLKFSISFALYGGSFLYASGFFQTLSKRKARLFNSVMLTAPIAGSVDLILIFAQALLYKIGAPEACIFFCNGAQRLAILPLAFADFALLYFIVTEKQQSTIFRSALSWGAVLAACGFIPGFLLLLPYECQNALAVSLIDPGEIVSMPLLGWNLNSGDLRIPHFIGLHALQILPLAAFVIERFLDFLDENQKCFLISNFAFAYFAAILIFSWQALKAESFFAAGSQTAMILLFLFCSSLLTAWLGLRLQLVCKAKEKAAKPEAAKPEAAKPEAAKPEADMPEAAKAKSAQPA